MTKKENHPILYSFRRCPYAMRARMALFKAGLTVELREIILRDKPAHMLEISPKGTVPVLMLADGTVIDESLDIMHYALKQSDPEGWLQANEETTNFLIKRNDTGFKYALDRYKYPNRYPDEDCTDMFDRGAATLKDLNKQIEQNGSLVTEQNTLADFAIFPFIRQFANTDRERFDNLGLTALTTWLDTHIGSTLFESIMKKYTRWSPNQDGNSSTKNQAFFL